MASFPPYETNPQRREPECGRFDRTRLYAGLDGLPHLGESSAAVSATTFLRAVGVLSAVVIAGMLGGVGAWALSI